MSLSWSIYSLVLVPPMQPGHKQFALDPWVTQSVCLQHEGQHAPASNSNLEACLSTYLVLASWLVAFCLVLACCSSYEEAAGEMNGIRNHNYRKAGLYFIVWPSSPSLQQRQIEQRRRSKRSTEARRRATRKRWITRSHCCETKLYKLLVLHIYPIFETMADNENDDDLVDYDEEEVRVVRLATNQRDHRDIALSPLRR